MITDTCKRCLPRLTRITLDGDAMMDLARLYQFFIFTF